MVTLAVTISQYALIICKFGSRLVPAFLGQPDDAKPHSGTFRCRSGAVHSNKVGPQRSTKGSGHVGDYHGRARAALERAWNYHARVEVFSDSCTFGWNVSLWLQPRMYRVLWYQQEKLMPRHGGNSVHCPANKRAIKVTKPHWRAGLGKAPAWLRK